MNNKGIIFDLDGTLWEVIDVTCLSLNQIIKKYNLKEVSKEIICSCFGLNKEECAKIYFPYLELEKSIMIIDEYNKINVENLKKFGGNLYPDVKEVIKVLQKEYKLFIVSNTAEDGYIEAFLQTSKLQNYFTDYFAAGKLNSSKSEAIKKIQLDYNLEKVIYVGDTKKDLEAAQLANVEFVQAKYGFGNDLHCKYNIDNIIELSIVINKIFKTKRG